MCKPGGQRRAAPRGAGSCGTPSPQLSVRKRADASRPRFPEAVHLSAFQRQNYGRGRLKTGVRAAFLRVSLSLSTSSPRAEANSLCCVVRDPVWRSVGLDSQPHSEPRPEDRASFELCTSRSTLVKTPSGLWPPQRIRQLCGLSRLLLNLSQSHVSQRYLFFLDFAK